jgi:methionine-rich copper-binding protein CopC
MFAHPISSAARGVGILAVAVMIAAASTRHQASAAAPRAGLWHVHLVRSEPANNDTLHAPPAAIKLWFSEDPELAITSVALNMSMGASTMPIAVSAVHRDAAAHSPIVADITGRLAPGSYTIAWKTAATDGHPASGAIAFVVAGSR